jgi:hypothetical protein
LQVSGDVADHFASCSCFAVYYSKRNPILPRLIPNPNPVSAPPLDGASRAGDQVSCYACQELTKSPVPHAKNRPHVLFWGFGGVTSRGGHAGAADAVGHNQQNALLGWSKPDPPQEGAPGAAAHDPAPGPVAVGGYPASGAAAQPGCAPVSAHVGFPPAAEPAGHAADALADAALAGMAVGNLLDAVLAGDGGGGSGAAAAQPAGATRAPGSPASL